MFENEQGEPRFMFIEDGKAVFEDNSEIILPDWLCVFEIPGGTTPLCSTGCIRDRYQPTCVHPMPPRYVVYLDQPGRTPSWPCPNDDERGHLPDHWSEWWGAFGQGTSYVKGWIEAFTKARNTQVG